MRYFMRFKNKINFKTRFKCHLFHFFMYLWNKTKIKSLKVLLKYFCDADLHKTYSYIALSFHLWNIPLWFDLGFYVLVWFFDIFFFFNSHGSGEDWFSTRWRNFLSASESLPSPVSDFILKNGPLSSYGV